MTIRKTNAIAMLPSIKIDPAVTKSLLVNANAGELKPMKEKITASNVIVINFPLKNIISHLDKIRSQVI